MRMVVGSEGAQGSRSDRIAELEARNEDLVRKVKVFQVSQESESPSAACVSLCLRCVLPGGLFRMLPAAEAPSTRNCRSQRISVNLSLLLSHPHIL
jgi:hypothetical protein